MLHQAHCVEYFRIALGWEGKGPGPGLNHNVHAGHGGKEMDANMIQHVQHCLYYLQFMTLCEADTGLEPGDSLSPLLPESANADADADSSDGQSYSRECRRWDELWDATLESSEMYVEMVRADQ